jgi:hypothetical protein
MSFTFATYTRGGSAWKGIACPASTLEGPGEAVERGVDEHAIAVAMADPASEETKIRMVLRDT